MVDRAGGHRGAVLDPSGDRRAPGAGLHHRRGRAARAHHGVGGPAVPGLRREHRRLRPAQPARPGRRQHAAGRHHRPVRVVPLGRLLAGRRGLGRRRERHLRRRRCDLPLELRQQQLHPDPRHGAGPAAPGRRPAAAATGPPAAQYRRGRCAPQPAAVPPGGRGGRGRPAGHPDQPGDYHRRDRHLGRPAHRAAGRGAAQRARVGPSGAAQQLPGADPDRAVAGRGDPASGAATRPGHGQGAGYQPDPGRRRRRRQRRRPVPP